ncbi:bifunctional UDP-N-acetylglucosamine diphosphorylase/glucosamine-1-phosphate N-acetyltransferase GlmU [Taylorella equigenitalis]|uniref:bifunctional UDP-N-acetylglucosamine diphosphorylase/glucosamine-1-phosphate N-acetyltransferase GlmU n=1 Tax=Taylorella equigenitalis TaxID=29575 RepID=UPI000409953C|nr:bifunctional UDP-N-acetylglucosamine diphosphorylase/glucosamine-1-phosphate N-acetyltransferase GlmU [Taylorella equigenitalis]ASY29867.1 UDP-N-acetylglucosamine diphosphorylase/glucosamine-1-phosphate N-acetyltransferase [Taylorella equigenitalis]ASY40161.1 UDP-N-acetylglucosamine diphosphorylase/glucosamine-1-phosphate N-acetyltransferase [Taylorella equigenitalis]KOS58915.1 bifunctional N-acetylglucosamine-1-phosphate uridyltransferase/glucosamine-1-phosphate acetyltransferase [Taylorella
MILNIVILAAGKGKRMKSNLPKVLHKIASKPMLMHVLDTASELQADTTTVVIGHGADKVKNACEGIENLNFALQDPPQGTGHAVLQASSFLKVGDADNSKTLILYGDVPLIQAYTLKKLIESSGAGVGLLTEYLEDPTGYGRIIRNSSGFVESIVEQKDASEDELKIKEINTGIICAPTSNLLTWLTEIKNDNAQGEYYLTDIIKFANRDGVPIIATQAYTQFETAGVNSRLQLAGLEEQYQKNKAYELLDDGVSIVDPSKFMLRGKLSCESDVTIDIGCIFEGDVEIKSGAHIGPYCIIKDSIIGSNARIEAFSHIDGATLSNDVVVGPYARLRPGTNLKDHSHVGNFMELKKTTLGSYSKANHLSYLGDATIGDRVNVGAGTITCNYDGVNKFQTIIEDEAFIGSDTQLVAPVTVGKGATVAAGTTVMKDVPASQLVLNKKTQDVISGWQRPQKKKDS